MARWAGFLINVLIILVTLYLFGIAEYHWPGTTPVITEKPPGETINRAVRETIMSGALLIRSYREDQWETERLEGGLKIAKKSGSADKVKEYQQAISEVQNRQGTTLTLFISQISTSAREYTAPVLSEQLEMLKQELGKYAGTKQTILFAQEFVEQVKSFTAGQAMNKELLGKRMLEI